MHTVATAPLALETLLPGFSDPIKESQTCFRALMKATAQPGTVANFGHAPTPPAGLNRAAGASLLTLADQETHVWLDPTLRGTDVESWLRFHTGAPVTTVPSEAAFALVANLNDMPELGQFNQGDAKYPDLATTLILMLPDLNGGPKLTLRGPGIETEILIAPQGLDADFWEARAELVAHFQFGIDLFLCADDQLLSLPRTTRITA